MLYSIYFVFTRINIIFTFRFISFVFILNIIKYVLNQSDGATNIVVTTQDGRPRYGYAPISPVPVSRYYSSLGSFLSIPATFQWPIWPPKYSSPKFAQKMTFLVESSREISHWKPRLSRTKHSRDVLRWRNFWNAYTQLWKSMREIFTSITILKITVYIFSTLVFAIFT